jgi:predicted phosphodiesterase
LILLSKELPSSHNLYLIGDSHEGSTLKDKSGYSEALTTVLNDPIGYMVHMGDLCEAITIDDKRYSADSVDRRSDVPLLQYKYALEDLAPLAEANKLLVILAGNHDLTLAKYGNFVRDMLCATLKVSYGTFTTKLTITNNDWKMYKLFLTHGFGSISSKADDEIRVKANMLLSLKRKLYKKAADCEVMAMGHTHKLLSLEPIPTLYLTDNGVKIKQHYTGAFYEGIQGYIPTEMRYYCNTGSFYKLYEDGISGYAERFGYDPMSLGYIKIEVRDGKILHLHEIAV